MTPQGPIRLTAQKIKQLKDELDELVSVGRKILADKLEEYRNDERSEDNSAYSEVLEEKRWMEQRIRELEETIEHAEIAEPKCDLDRVSLGCSVTLKRDGKKMTFMIVPSLEANPSEGKISEESPIGKALLGRRVGDKVVVKSPDARCNCEILKIAVSDV